jgi:2-polyprenyl-3-methyl-5-hydroxy-6-metoxy-1,4-benzoquinol methylase
MSPSASRLEKLCAAIAELNPMQENFLDRSRKEIEPRELVDLERYIDHCLAAGVTLAELAASYELIVADTLREQLHFKRHGRYRYSRYDEVAGSVYLSPEYMQRYMHGLALTSFLWPNHAAMRRYFAEQLPAEQGGRYLEIGPGHGFYFMTALRQAVFTDCHGVDISPTSVALTRALLAGGTFGSFQHWSVEERDFLAAEVSGPYAMVTMGEVLEHVEDPLRFLTRAGEVCARDGRVFITSCINSPALDHIYLFRSIDEVRDLVRNAKLRVKSELVLPYTGTSLEESARAKLPVNFAMVLEHREAASPRSRDH